jgi:hypothetical protein
MTISSGCARATSWSRRCSRRRSRCSCSGCTGRRWRGAGAGGDAGGSADGAVSGRGGQRDQPERRARRAGRRQRGARAAVVLLASVSHGATEVAVGWIAATALGAVLGFLVHNRHPARVFMGDAGSYFLGFLLTGLLLLIHPVRERVADQAVDPADGAGAAAVRHDAGDRAAGAARAADLRAGLRPHPSPHARARAGARARGRAAVAVDGAVRRAGVPERDRGRRVVDADRCVCWRCWSWRWCSATTSCCARCRRSPAIACWGCATSGAR